MPDKEDGGIFRGLGRMFRGGVEKSKRLGRLGLLKLVKQKASGERDTINQQIGRLTVKRIRDSGDKQLDASDPALQHLLADLKEADEKIEAIQQHIDELKAGGAAEPDKKNAEE